MVYEGQNIQKGPVLYDKIAEYKTRSSALYQVFLTAFVLQVCYLNCNVVSSLLYLLVPPCLGLLEPYSTSSPPPSLIQSLTVPLQGFLNAIVYGWTKEDFLDAMAIKDQEEASSDDGGGMEDSVIIQKYGSSLTSSTASVQYNAEQATCKIVG